MPAGCSRAPATQVALACKPKDRGRSPAPSGRSIRLPAQPAAPEVLQRARATARICRCYLQAGGYDCSLEDSDGTYMPMLSSSEQSYPPASQEYSSAVTTTGLGIRCPLLRSPRVHAPWPKSEA